MHSIYSSVGCFLPVHVYFYYLIYSQCVVIMSEQFSYIGQSMIFYEMALCKIWILWHDMAQCALLINVFYDKMYSTCFFSSLLHQFCFGIISVSVLIRHHIYQFKLSIYLPVYTICSVYFTISYYRYMFGLISRSICSTSSLQNLCYTFTDL